MRAFSLSGWYILIFILVVWVVDRPKRSFGFCDRWTDEVLTESRESLHAVPVGISDESHDIELDASSINVCSVTVQYFITFYRNQAGSKTGEAYPVVPGSSICSECTGLMG